MLTALTTPASGPSVTVHGWLAWLILAGAVCLALLAVRQLVTQVLIPVAVAARRVISAIDVIFEIASEFRPNSGTTLHDRLLTIDRTTANTHETLEALWDYSHESRHSIVNALTQIAPGVDIIAELAKKLHAVPEPMPEEPT